MHVYVFYFMGNNVIVFRPFSTNEWNCCNSVCSTNRAIYKCVGWGGGGGGGGGEGTHKFKNVLLGIIHFYLGGMR